MQLSPTFRGSSLVLCWFLPCPDRVGELPLAQVDCLSGFTHHSLDLFAHILTPPTLQQDFGSSAQCSAVALCLCFHQLLDEGSVLTYMIVIKDLFTYYVHSVLSLCMLAGQQRAPDLIIDGCEPPCGCRELNSGSLEEQSVLLTSEPSLQPWAYQSYGGIFLN